MYGCISHLDSTVLLYALRILQEQLHYVSQASVSPLWSEFHLLKYLPSTCMKTFVQEVKRIANSLHCDGRSLQPPRLGPDPRAVLQKLIDALIAIPEFNVEVARGQAILEQAQVTLSELNRFFIVIVDAARPKFPGVNNIVAAFFPLVCSNCGGAGHDIHSCSSARGGSKPADNGTSRPQAADRNMRLRDRPGDRSPSNTRSNRPTGNTSSTGRRVAPKGPISGPSVLLPQLEGPAPKGPSASNVYAVLRPRSGSLVWACAVPRSHLPTVLLGFATKRTLMRIVRTS